jgi:phosphogluconate dehydratase
MHSVVESITNSIEHRSKDTRRAYLEGVDAARNNGPQRNQLSCGNLAHGFAACNPSQKKDLSAEVKANIAIISSYNDILSAHQPFKNAPDLIKNAIEKAGGVAQFASGVPAMCDGVTQGQAGMELSLFSRDIIAMATGIALSHNLFDGALYLGVCDKIVPGLLIGALHFGHLPALFVPAGPMTSGLPNSEKNRIRQDYAEGKIDKSELLEAESASYHSPGTCTFYGTANSNQMIMEIMGLHLPGSSFINANTPLRDELTKAAARQILKFTAEGDDYRPLAHVINEKAIVNAIVGLLATGGSSNHTIHLVAIARAAGIQINWDDFDTLSKIVPLLTRIYPNGEADINHFEAAGGMGVLISTLSTAGLLHEDVLTMSDEKGLQHYNMKPVLSGNKLIWNDCPQESLNSSVLSHYDKPFDTHGGLLVISGNLGRGIIKVSALKAEHKVIEAPAIIFNEQTDLDAAFKAGGLNKNFVAIVRFQGPRANGMPELHKLLPCLGSLQDKGFKVALITDGRMSGASGKVPAAIHLCPESINGGPLAKVRSGDIVSLDANNGSLNVLVDQHELDKRIPLTVSANSHTKGFGREMFEIFRQQVSSAEEGASSFLG